MLGQVRRLMVALFVGALLSPGIAGPPVAGVAAAVAPDTVFVVDPYHPNINTRRATYRPPDALVSGWFRQTSEGWVQAQADANGQSISVHFWTGEGTTLQLGHTYTNVQQNYGGADPSQPRADCSNATITVWEVEADAVGQVTKLAMDYQCPHLVGYTIRINSTLGYALLDAVEPAFPDPIFPGEITDAIYTIASVGTMAVTISGITIRDYGLEPFSVPAETCTGSALAPGDMCTATVRFAPASAFDGWAVLWIASNTAAGTLEQYSHASTKDPLRLNASSLAFGSTPATVATAPRRLDVTYLGPDSATIAAMNLLGANPGDFEVTSETCTGAPLATGDTCSAQVTATPHAVGPVSATLQLDGDSAIGDRSVSLSATGTDPITVSPDVTLPEIRPGSSTTGTVTLTSLAAVSLPVTSVGLVDSSPAFSITGDTCTAGIPAGGSCDVAVTYTVPAAGSVYNANMESAGVRVIGPGLVGTRTARVHGSHAEAALGASWSLRSSIGRRWNFGNGLARAVYSTTTTLLEVGSSDRVGSSAVKDSGPRMPVYLNRSIDGGAHWSSALRVNATTQHGIWPVVAASGRYVAVAWAAASRVVSWSNTAPRALYVRVSTNSGNGSWRSTLRLTSSTARIDHPAIAMSGSIIVIGYTDSATGYVKLALSKDRGLTWRTISLGTTSLAASWGRTGLVSVAVSGSTIAASWLSSSSGSVKVRISTNSGASWQTTATLGTGATDQPSVAVASGRVGVVWTGTGAVNVRVRGSAWSPVRIVPVPFSPEYNYWPGTYTYPYRDLYSPTISLYGAAGVAVAWSGTYYYCSDCDVIWGSDLLWSESSTNGAGWTAPDRLATPDWTYLYRDDASIVWVSSTTRYVLANGWGYDSKLALIRGITAGLAPAHIPAGRPASPALTQQRAAVGDQHEPRGFAGPWGDGSKNP